MNWRMNKKIRVMIKEPGQAPKITKISNSPFAIEKLIEGRVDELIVGSDFVILHSGNGEHLPYCCTVCGKDFYGTVIFCGLISPNDDSGSLLADLPVSYHELRRVFPQLWAEE